METCPNCNNANIHFWVEFDGNQKKAVTVCIACNWRNEDITIIEKAGDDATK